MLQLESELARLREELVAGAGGQALGAVAATHRTVKKNPVPVRQAPVPYRAGGFRNEA